MITKVWNLFYDDYKKNKNSFGQLEFFFVRITKCLGYAFWNDYKSQLTNFFVMITRYQNNFCHVLSSIEFFFMITKVLNLFFTNYNSLESFLVVCEEA